MDTEQPDTLAQDLARITDAEGVARILEAIDTLSPVRALRVANEVLKGHGVERVANPAGVARYVNMGDTYDATLVHVGGVTVAGELCGGDFRVTSWGDALEALEAEHTEDTGEERCGYCGEYSDKLRQHEARSWSARACPSCRAAHPARPMPGTLDPLKTREARDVFRSERSAQWETGPDGTIRRK